MKNYSFIKTLGLFSFLLGFSLFSQGQQMNPAPGNTDQVKPVPASQTSATHQAFTTQKVADPVQANPAVISGTSATNANATLSPEAQLQKARVEHLNAQPQSAAVNNTVPVGTTVKATGTRLTSSGVARPSITVESVGNVSVMTIPVYEIAGLSRSPLETESEYYAKLHTNIASIKASAYYSNVTFDQAKNAIVLQFAGEKVPADAVKADIQSRISAGDPTKSTH